MEKAFEDSNKNFHNESLDLGTSLVTGKILRMKSEK
jgi:hypothetical protein